MDGAKVEAVRQWSADPCGAGPARGLTPGTREYFDRIDRNRYEVYAPWMERVLPLDSAEGCDVLEVGCGLGSDLLRFARGGARCHGVDLTPTHLALTAARFRVYGQRARLARADAEALPYAADSFDLAYSFGVIHHTPGTELAVSEIHRVLRPGGTAWVAVYHRDSAYFWLWLVLVYGLLHGALFRRGWRGLLADIEQREASDAQPLVKVYTRASAARLFHEFREVRVTVHHLEPTHFPVIRRLVPFRILRRLESRLGWYLVVQATK
jgi:SAM-dependent methyltransferase